MPCTYRFLPTCYFSRSAQRVVPVTKMASGYLTGGLGGVSQAHFYVYPDLLKQSSEIRDCFLNQTAETELSRTQFLFELDVFESLSAHPLRTSHKAEASVFVLPLLPFVSRQAGTCHLPTRSDHSQRVAQTLALLRTTVEFSAGPHLMTCTCVMQRSVYSPPLFELLLGQSTRTITLSQARRAPPLSLSYMNVIVPYHSAPSLISETCSGGSSSRNGVVSGSVGGNGSLGVFAGSVSVGREQATGVRTHIANLSLAAPNLFAVRRTERRADSSPCGSDGSCVNGFLYGSRHERVPAKPQMAALMHSSDYCFVPEGDSPESSRLFDAIASL